MKVIKFTFTLLILIPVIQMLVTKAMALDDISVTVRYYPPGQSIKELTLKDADKIKKIGSYWEEYKNFPDGRGSCAGGFFQLVYYYPNGDYSYSVVIYDGVLEITEREEPKVYLDTNDFYNFLVKELKWGLPICTDPKLTVIYSIYSGRPNPGWSICDENTIKLYQSYIEALEPIQNIRSCGFKSFIVYPEGLDWEFGRRLLVCEDGVSESQGSHYKTVKDKLNLYQYLKTQFLDQLLSDSRSDRDMGHNR